MHFYSAHSLSSALGFLKEVRKKWAHRIPILEIPILPVWSHLLRLHALLGPILRLKGMVPVDHSKRPREFERLLTFRINARLLVAELGSRVKSRASFSYWMWLNWGALPYLGRHFLEHTKLSQQRPCFSSLPNQSVFREIPIPLRINKSGNKP